MPSDYWQEVKEALATLNSLTGIARRNYYNHLETNMPMLAKEVKELLEASEAANDQEFLDRPAYQEDKEEFDRS